MNISGNDFNQVSDNLLAFLKDRLGDTKIDYASPPTKLQGGNETSIFHFKLKNVQPSLLRPLILRKFRKEHRSNHAIMEKNVHNSLVDQGFPVPYVHYSCTDQSYFGSQFLIMDFLPGEILPLVLGQDTAIVLGKTHAALHNANSSPLSEAMIADGFEERQNNIKAKLDRLLNASGYLPWLEDICTWLIENRPSNCEYPSICHGDFHPGNLLAKDSVVSAILDWSCCYIGDPAMDVASTMVVFNAATKHLIPSFDSNIETQNYLTAYKSVRDLNEKHIEFYQVLGCVIALFAGKNGVLVWTQPPIQNELLNIIYNYSKIRVKVPG